MIEVRLDTPAGPRIVRSRTLVVAIPPTLRHLAGFDLDRIEEATFARLRSQCYATRAKLAGLPAGLSIHNNASRVTVAFFTTLAGGRAGAHTRLCWRRAGA